MMRFKFEMHFNGLHPLPDILNVNMLRKCCHDLDERDLDDLNDTGRELFSR
jgi:hypothetical protein